MQQEFLVLTEGRHIFSPSHAKKPLARTVAFYCPRWLMSFIIRLHLWHPGFFFGHVIGPLLPNVVWSRLLNTGLIPFCVFHGPQQIRTNLANTQQSSLLQAQSINHKCYTFTKLSAFQVIIIIITCITYVNNVFIIYASFVNNSHMFLAVIFLQQLLIKYVLKKTQQAFPPALPMSDVVALVKLPIMEQQTSQSSWNLLHLCLDNLPWF